jgi:hypothetical protein
MEHAIQTFRVPQFCQIQFPEHTYQSHIPQKETDGENVEENHDKATMKMRIGKKKKKIETAVGAAW